MCDRASPAVGDSDLGGRGFTGSEPADWSPASGAHRCPILVVLATRARSTLLPKAERSKESDHEAPLGPGRPPRMKIYGALVAAKNRALLLAFPMPGVNWSETAPGHLE
jgi:hypothetical protein